MADYKHIEVAQLLVNGIRPASVNRKIAGAYLGEVKLFEKMLYNTRYLGDPWFEIVNNAEGAPKETILIDTLSLENAARRFKSGDKPIPVCSHSELAKFQEALKKSKEAEVHISQMMIGISFEDLDVLSGITSQQEAEAKAFAAAQERWSEKSL